VVRLAVLLAHTRLNVQLFTPNFDLDAHGFYSFRKSRETPVKKPHHRANQTSRSRETTAESFHSSATWPKIERGNAEQNYSVIVTLTE
ncbi:MAG: hypothetical protein LBF51_09975, partial [Zoogloeaceae bacterium]|nr:hypothetical protein [Zoogloeaceae bacterium]